MQDAKLKYHVRLKKNQMSRFNQLSKFAEDFWGLKKNQMSWLNQL